MSIPMAIMSDQTAVNAVMGAVLLGVLIAVVMLVYRQMRAETLRVEGMHENRCPQCGYDLRMTPDRCPECGTVPDFDDDPRAPLDAAMLRDGWLPAPIEPRQPDATEFLVAVHVSTNPLETNLLQEQLQSRGIRCHVRRSPSRRIIAYTQPVMDQGITTVQVYSGDLPEVREYLRTLRRSRRLRASES